MQLQLTLTTLVTILFMATACASEPAPTPDTRETDRLSRQVQKLQAENEIVRNELAMLTIAAQVSGIENDLPEDSLPTDNPSNDVPWPQHDVVQVAPTSENTPLPQISNEVAGKLPGTEAQEFREISTDIYVQFVCSRYTPGKVTEMEQLLPPKGFEDFHEDLLATWQDAEPFLLDNDALSVPEVAQLVRTLNGSLSIHGYPGWASLLRLQVSIYELDSSAEEALLKAGCSL